MQESCFYGKLITKISEAKCVRFSPKSRENYKFNRIKSELFFGKHSGNLRPVEITWLFRLAMIANHTFLHRRRKKLTHVNIIFLNSNTSVVKVMFIEIEITAFLVALFGCCYPSCQNNWSTSTLGAYDSDRVYINLKSLFLSRKSFPLLKRSWNALFLFNLNPTLLLRKIPPPQIICDAVTIMVLYLQ